ncbi:hypothetical protein BGX27_002664 [Mortierella sp. AM989]|nr:hypothetical protein BGX27_002664 [Mortierella sp. AM989]
MTISQHKHQRPARWLANALLSATVMAAGAQAACISLAGSAACPSYSSFFVDTSIIKTVSSYSIAMPSFTTLAEFDKAVFNSTGFFTSTDCTGYSSSVRIPYQDTLLCTIAVQDNASKKCKGQPTITNSNMCASSCTLYGKGLTAMIKEKCPKATNALGALKDLTTICSRADTDSWSGLQDNASDCIDSLKNEATFCGLGSLVEKCSYCKANSTNTCCSDAATKCSPPTSNTTAPPVTNTNPKPSSTVGAGNGNGNGNSDNNSPDSKTGLSPDTLGAIVGGTVGGLFLIAAVIICIRRAKRVDSPKQSSLARQISNSSARYNISNPKLQEEGFVGAAPIPMATLPPISTEPSSLGLSNMAAGAGAVAGAGATVGRNAPAKLSYCQALYPYQASMADELDLTPGDLVNVQKVFDDGWAVGINMNTSKEGAFPVVCVMFVDESSLDDDFEDVNMHSMPPMTLREEDQEGRRSPSGRNSPRSSLPSRSSSPVHLPRRNSSIRENTVIIPGINPMTSSPLAGNNQGGSGRMTPPVVRDTMMSDASSINRW